MRAIGTDVERLNRPQRGLIATASETATRCCALDGQDWIDGMEGVEHAQPRPDQREPDPNI